MLTLALVLGAAALAGCVDAMVGGGGLIQLPALLAAYPAAVPARVLGTNKCASIFGTASAVAHFARTLHIPWRLLSAGIGLALVASLAGAMAATHVPPDVFRPLVPVLLVAVLANTLARKDFGRLHEPRRFERAHYALAALLVGAIGFYDGFFGPGTGSFFMVLFIRLFGYDFVNAAACARVLNVATNLSAILWFGWHGHIDWSLGLTMAVFNVAGAQIGSRLALRGGTRLIRRVFIVVVVALIVKNAWNVLGP